MKAMILAAGFGTRMRPLTDTTPKPLLKVGEKSLIEHHLEQLSNASITDVIINVSYLGEQIEQTIGTGQEYGLQITYSRESQPLETAGAIYHARELLGDSPFLLINGDVITDYPLQALMRVHPEYAHLVLIPKPKYLVKGDFSYHLDRIGHKEPLAYTYSGLGVFNPKWFDAVESLNEDRLGKLLHRQVDQQQTPCPLTAEIYQGAWIDVGTPERLEMANMMFAGEQ